MESRRLPVLALLALLGVGAATAARSLAEGDSMVTSEIMGDHTMYTVNWTKGIMYEDIMAACGDMVEFVWEGNMHDVGVADDGDCDSITPLVDAATSGSYMVTLNGESFAEVEELGEIYFACSVGSHCAAGQKIEFYVSSCGNSTTTY